MNFNATYKLILIGNSGVGKSSIIKRIGGSNTFKDGHDVTIGAEFTTIATKINKKTNLKLQFWDSCGQERYNSITRLFYRGSSCVVLVYDVTKLESLRNLEVIWINDLKESLRDAILILVGNKADIDGDYQMTREVSYQQGKAVMKKYNLNYFTEVSAKQNSGIQDLVNHISKSLYLLKYLNSSASENGSDSDYNSPTKSGNKESEEEDSYSNSNNSTSSP